MKSVLEHRNHDRTNQRKPEEKMDPVDYYALMRGHITQTHDLINQRTIWLSISQSFFYGGYGGIANAPKEAKNAVFSGQQDLLLWLLPLAAIVACAAVYTGLIGRVIHLLGLRKQFELYVGDTDALADYPSIDAPPLVRTMEKIAYLMLPAVFMAGWIFILAKQSLSQP